MHVLVHDFAGYAFTVALARELAARGHAVTYAWCPSVTTTPSGATEPLPGDPPTLEFRPVALPRPLDKVNLVRRFRDERAYGRLAAAALAETAPDLVLSSNTPLDAQRTLLAEAARRGTPFVYWLQDLIGLATRDLLGRRSAALGAAVGRRYMRLEADLLRRSAAIVAITDDFRPYLRGLGVTARIATIENWAPVEQLPVRSKRNGWSQLHGLDGRFVFLYSGTLGRKHDPSLLLRLAQRFADDDGVRIVVVSEGAGARYLTEQAVALGLANLLVLPYVPFDRVPDVMGSADALVALLEPAAGAFSVPSKVLAYLCAERPLLLSVPAGNLAAAVVEREAAGLRADPGDDRGFVELAVSLRNDVDGRRRMGRAGRRYAEQAFALREVTNRFEPILEAAA